MMEQIYLLTGIGVTPASGKDIYFSIACRGHYIPDDSNNKSADLAISV